jgi:NADPH2:quinone reductase
MRAIRFAKTGDASVLQLQNLPIPTPQAGQVLVQTSFAGVNLIDTYMRKGVYPVAFGEHGAGLGSELCGSVVAVGPDVTRFRVGDFVATVGASAAAYATHAAVAQEQVLAVPQGLEPDVVAASFLKGMTARYLCKETFVVKPGHNCLVYAAAGGKKIFGNMTISELIAVQQSLR